MGLTTCDIILINQIIGFVGFQARVVAIFQAYHGHPVRWVPGLDIQQFADAQLFQEKDAQWHPAQEGVEIRYASAEQLECLSHHQPVAELLTLAPVLVHEPALLSLLGTLLTSALRTDAPPASLPLATLLTSRINGSVACFNEQSRHASEWAETISVFRRGEREIQHWESQHPVERPVTQAIQWLTRAPDRFSAAQFTPLLEQGASLEQAVNLLGWCGLCGWLNRLKIALGETH